MNGSPGVGAVLVPDRVDGVAVGEAGIDLGVAGDLLDRIQRPAGGAVVVALATAVVGQCEIDRGGQVGLVVGGAAGPGAAVAAPFGVRVAEFGAGAGAHVAV